MLKNIPSHLAKTVDLLLERDQLMSFNERHETVDTAVGPVDVRISDLVEILNCLGLITQFSCEGDQHLWDQSSHLSNKNSSAHVIFEKLEHAAEFVKIVTDSLCVPWKQPRGSALEITLLPALDSSGNITEGCRAMVCFEPNLIEDYTAVMAKRLMSLECVKI